MSAPRSVAISSEAVCWTKDNQDSRAAARQLLLIRHVLVLVDDHVEFSGLCGECGPLKPAPYGVPFTNAKLT